MASDPDRFRVAPSLTNLPLVAATPVDSQTGAQLQQAGRAITGAGRVAAGLYEDVLDKQNKTRVREAMVKLTEYRNENTYGEFGWSKLKSGNALNRPNGKALDDEYGEDLDNYAQTLAQSLGNDAQRELFGQLASETAVEYRSRIQQHAARESEVYERETIGGQVSAFSRQLSMAQSESEIDEARAGIGAAMRDLFSLDGTAAEMQPYELRKALTPAHAQQISRMMTADDLDGAEQYANKYRDEIDEVTYTKISEALIEQRGLIQGENDGESVWGVFQGAAGASQPQEILLPYHGEFRQSSAFGQRGGRLHAGKDMAMPVGTPVRAGADGVARVKRDPKGYGLYVDLELDNGTVLRMAHLDGTDVKDGDRVRQGQVIARSGNSGKSTGPHLHYEVRVDGKPVDPATFHEGRPKTKGTGAASGSLSDMLAYIDERDDWSPKRKARAKEIVKERWSARDADERRRDEQIVSRAYAEIDSSGSLSKGTRSAIVAADLGSSLPSLRSYEKARAERAAGVPVSTEDSLEAYGRVQIGIAKGEIRDISQLMRYAPFVGNDTLFKQLIDDFAASPQTASQKAAGVLKEMEPDIAASGIFAKTGNKKRDEEREKRYNQFVGTVASSIAGEELNTSKPVTVERRREIVLGLLAKSQVGEEWNYNFQVRQLYDNVPSRARIEAVRRLRQRGVANPTINDVVEVWQSLNETQQQWWSRQ